MLQDAESAPRVRLRQAAAGVLDLNIRDVRAKQLQIPG